MERIKSIALLLFLSMGVLSQNSKRWGFSDNFSIRWVVKKEAPHTDQIEMSGNQISAIVTYGVDTQHKLILDGTLCFPSLRVLPNITDGLWCVEMSQINRATISVNGMKMEEYPKEFEVKGKIVITSATNTPLEIKRVVFPSVDRAALIQIITLRNTGSEACKVNIQNHGIPVESDPLKCAYGKYVAEMEVNGEGPHTIAPYDECTIGVVYAAKKSIEEPYHFSTNYELNKREKLVNELFSDLVLDTPNDTIDRAFAFAKIRTVESINDTKGGLLHAPGGGCYYAAVWANDQAEYANPFFPFLGNISGNESAINSFRYFAKYMNPDYRPLPCSIIAEGVGIWNDAGDRGDQAMIAYGASRFALAMSRKDIAKELYPLITWCLEYLERKKMPEGIIASDMDELENRFPAGKANLSTNSLAYGAYLGAANLADELGRNNQAADYRKKAQTLRVNMEKYFGANVEGYNTYRYYAENTKLRAWICMPLAMGITDRRDETVKALLSDKLWTPNGILTESGSTTFWDRATLYAFRGLFISGATDICMDYFSYYSTTRLLGEHVPYPVEAWPEGGQRHLAAESALYCRAVTEGLFGIIPTGFHQFTVAPRLPKGWKYMRLHNIKAFGQVFDVEARRKGSGETITVKTINGKVIKKKWDGKEPLTIDLP